MFQGVKIYAYNPAVPDVQNAYNNTTLSYGKAFEGKAFLEQAREIITEDEKELFDLLIQAQEKLNDAVVVTRAADQAVAQLMVAVRRSHSLS
ncbi:MAG: hypothetical protein NVSMB49_19190 [Ktedonobacteraceae bacterium]